MYSYCLPCGLASSVSLLAEFSIRVARLGQCGGAAAEGRMTSTTDQSLDGNGTHTLDVIR